MTWHIYDYFNHSPESQYWRSQTGGVPSEAARAAVNEMRSKVGNIKCNSWGPGDYIAGFQAADGNAAIFRVYNGGRDEAGRPHRWILLLLSGPVEQFRDLDLVEVLEQPPFGTYGANPVPPQAFFPEGLPARERRGGKPPVTPLVSFDDAGPGSLDRARSVFCQLANGEGTGTIVIESVGTGRRVWCKVEKIAKIIIGKLPPSGTAANPTSHNAGGTSGANQGASKASREVPLISAKWGCAAAILVLIFLSPLMLRSGRDADVSTKPRSNPAPDTEAPSSSPFRDSRGHEAPTNQRLDRGRAAEVDRSNATDTPALSSDDLQALKVLSNEFAEHARRYGIILENPRAQGNKLIFEIRPPDANGGGANDGGAKRDHNRAPEDKSGIVDKLRQLLK